MKKKKEERGFTSIEGSVVITRLLSRVTLVSALHGFVGGVAFGTVKGSDSLETAVIRVISVSDLNSVFYDEVINYRQKGRSENRKKQNKHSNTT